MNPDLRASVLRQILVIEEAYYSTALAAQETRHTALRQTIELLMRPVATQEPAPEQAE